MNTFKLCYKIFFSNLCLSLGEDWASSFEDQKDQDQEDEVYGPQQPDELSPEEQEKLGDLEALKKELDYIDASEKITRQMIHSLGSNLQKIADGKEDGYSPEDPEYIALRAKYDAFVEAYDDLGEESQQINHIVEFRLNQLSGGVEAEIDSIAGAGHADSIEIDDNYVPVDIDTGEAVNENSSEVEANEQRAEFFSELNSITVGEISEQLVSEMLEKYSREDIEGWLENVQEEIGAGNNEIISSQLRDKSVKILGILETASFIEGQKLQEEVSRFGESLKNIDQSTLNNEIANEVVNEFGLLVIREWLDVKEDFINFGEDQQFVDAIKSEIQTVKKILELADEREFDKEMSELSEITEADFFDAYQQNDRLPFVTRGGIEASELKEGDPIEFQFNFQGEFNTDFERMTAGEVLPDTVGAIEHNGKTYIRNNVIGEFHELLEDGTMGESRLIILEGTKISIGDIRTPEELAGLEALAKSEADQTGYEGDAYDIALHNIRRGNNAPDKESMDALLNIAANGGNAESASNEATDIFGMWTEEELRNAGLIGYLLIQLHNLQNPEEEGGDSESTTSSPRGNLEGVGEYGPIGGQLASYINTNKPHIPGDSICGKNVGECLNQFGIEGLPQSERDGHKWDDFMEARPNQFEKVTSKYTPETAPPGAIISYGKNTGGSEMRQEYGHVEIALGGGQFYFGQINNHPGGTDEDVRPGEYEIYMPVAKKVDGSDRVQEVNIDDTEVVPEKQGMLQEAVSKAMQNKHRYESIASKIGCPWEAIAAIHYREASFNFDTYLHQGDPLGRPAVNIPNNIPVFNQWEDAAHHALTYDSWKDFTTLGSNPSESQVAELVEKFNGLGYRNKGLNSPYVWAGTDKYEGQGGMYVADGKFDRNKKDPRLGVMPIYQALRAQA